MNGQGRLLIAGTHSGCGKTTLACALLQALVNRGLHTAAFKCGPDYIDPMFHREIIGASCGNLDPIFHSAAVMRALLTENAGEVSLLEGAMGYFDGAGGQGSSWQVAGMTRTPAVVVIDCKGMGQSVGAIMAGFLQFRQPSRIAGFLFNRLSERMEPAVRQLCQELGTAYLGRFPHCPECHIESRHLGLVTAAEITDLHSRTARLAQLAEQYIDIDALLSCAATAPPLTAPQALFPRPAGGPAVRIAQACDRAFCFYYQEDLALLRRLGCELAPFSPLTAPALPEGCSGLLLGGGYPELYAGPLAANRPLREQLLQAVRGGLPTIAECGGFLYLHNTLHDTDGHPHDMVGLIDGTAYPTGKLQRFGYTTLTAKRDSLLCRAGETLKAHEFHYWESTACGEDFAARKISSGKTYSCGWAGPALYAGFPHLSLCATPQAAARFVAKCREYRENGDRNGKA